MESPAHLGIVFSRDRALQLDATLRSFFLHCQDANWLPITILYMTSTPHHELQYRQLIQEYASYPSLHFLRQTNFRKDLLKLLLPHPGSSLERAMQAALLAAGYRLGRVAARLLKPVPDRLALFLVDDNIFVDDFNLVEIFNCVHTNPEAIGFSLRLGRNTTFCYMRDQAQRVPEFSALTKRIQAFDWTKGELDFGYPLEVSSSVLRIDDVLPLLLQMPFHNPNTLESHLAIRAPVFKSIRPKLLCFEQSVTFCAPINKTNTGYRNRAGNLIEYSLESLAAEFAAGKRINVEAYSGMVPTGCHQEVELVFDQRDLPHLERVSHDG